MIAPACSSGTPGGSGAVAVGGRRRGRPGSARGSTGSGTVCRGCRSRRPPTYRHRSRENRGEDPRQGPGRSWPWVVDPPWDGTPSAVPWSSVIDSDQERIVVVRAGLLVLVPWRPGCTSDLTREIWSGKRRVTTVPPAGWRSPCRTRCCFRPGWQPSRDEVRIGPDGVLGAGPSRRVRKWSIAPRVVRVRDHGGTGTRPPPSRPRREVLLVRFVAEEFRLPDGGRVPGDDLELYGGWGVREPVQGVALGPPVAEYELK